MISSLRTAKTHVATCDTTLGSHVDDGLPKCKKLVIPWIDTQGRPEPPPVISQNSDLEIEPVDYLSRVGTREPDFG